MTLRSLLGASLLVAIAAASWLLVKSIEGGNSDGPAIARQSQGYYVKDAAILGTDAGGAMLYTVEAQEIRHLPRENVVALMSVAVRYSATGQPAWLVTSSTGRIDDASADLSLEGDVRLQNDSAATDDTYLIETETLLFSPRQRFARTDAAVRITQPGVILTATGMDADLENEILSLKAAVNGQFRP